MGLTPVKERGILMSAPMVRAILEGRKTQTRRVIKLSEGEETGSVDRWRISTYGARSRIIDCPYGKPRDRLWVRETFVIENSMEYERAEPVDRPFRWTAPREDGGALEVPHYRATEPEPHIVPLDGDLSDDRTLWRPSIFMPRWASRITLEIIGVRVERLQEISEADARAEGIEGGDEGGVENWARFCYRKLWNSLNEKRGFGWEVNPWVWVVEFRKL